MNPQEKEDFQRIQALLSGELHIINLGLELFAETFEQQGISYVHVDWRPPASGDTDLNDLLSALLGSK